LERVDGTKVDWNKEEAGAEVDITRKLHEEDAATVWIPDELCK
jgi:hypothetical protein